MPDRPAKILYDRLSHWYDALADRGERKFRQAGLALLNAAPGERILEIGFGTGHALKALSQSVLPAGLVVGIELSTGMIEVTREHVRRIPGPSPALVRADACALPFRSQSFNAVFASFVLELFEEDEIPVVLQECRRVLGGEGRLVIVSLARHKRPTGRQSRLSLTMTRLYGWIHNHFPKYVDCRPIDVVSALTRQGFVIVTVKEERLMGLEIDILSVRK